MFGKNKTDSLFLIVMILFVAACAYKPHPMAPDNATVKTAPSLKAVPGPETHTAGSVEMEAASEPAVLGRGIPISGETCFPSDYMEKILDASVDPTDEQMSALKAWNPPSKLQPMRVVFEEAGPSSIGPPKMFVLYYEPPSERDREVHIAVFDASGGTHEQAEALLRTSGLSGCINQYTLQSPNSSKARRRHVTEEDRKHPDVMHAQSFLNRAISTLGDALDVMPDFTGY